MRSMADEEEDATRGGPHESPNKKQKTSEQMQAKHELEQSPVQIKQEPLCSPAKRRQAYMSTFFSPKSKKEEDQAKHELEQSPVQVKQHKSESQASSSVGAVQINFLGQVVAPSPLKKEPTRQDFVVWGKKGGRPKQEQGTLRFSGKTAKEKYKARIDTKDNKNSGWNQQQRDEYP